MAIEMVIEPPTYNTCCQLFLRYLQVHLRMRNSTRSNAYGKPDRKISVSFTYVNYYSEIS